jgi:hypothetical protein
MRVKTCHMHLEKIGGAYPFMDLMLRILNISKNSILISLKSRSASWNRDFAENWLGENLKNGYQRSLDISQIVIIV